MMTLGRKVMAVTVTRLHLVVAAFMLAATLTVDAQQVQKVYRIGYMSIPSSQSAGDLLARVFLPALRERGLVEGKNLVIEWRWAERKPERLLPIDGSPARWRWRLLTDTKPSTRLSVSRSMVIATLTLLMSDLQSIDD
jgi:hypothetical protein